MSIISIHFPLFQLNLLTKTSCSCFLQFRAVLSRKSMPFSCVFNVCFFIAWFSCSSLSNMIFLYRTQLTDLKPRKTRDAIVSQLRNRIISAALD